MNVVIKEQRMSGIRTLLVSAACVGFAGFGAGCNPPPEQGQSFIEGVLTLVAPQCVADVGNDFQATALLDIGNNAGNASDLVLPLKVRTNLPSTFTTQTLGEDHTRSPNYSPVYGNTDENIITFQDSEVFFSTDEDRSDELQLGQVEGTPVNANSVRITGVAGTVFNQQTQLLGEGSVIATGVTRADAVLLQTEPFIAGAIQAGGTARIIVNIRLVGQTTGNTRVETPLFPFPVTLCAGCLVNAPNCGVDAAGNPIQPIPNDQVCIFGNNEPTFVCPP